MSDDDAPILSASCPIAHVAAVSRRDLLRGVSIAAGGAAVLLGSGAPADAKMPKRASKYQGAPKGKQSCSSCAHFEPPSSCGIVAGKISPHGWCRFYVKK